MAMLKEFSEPLEDGEYWIATPQYVWRLSGSTKIKVQAKEFLPWAAIAVVEADQPVEDMEYLYSELSAKTYLDYMLYRKNKIYLFSNLTSKSRGCTAQFQLSLAKAEAFMHWLIDQQLLKEGYYVTVNSTGRTPFYTVFRSMLPPDEQSVEILGILYPQKLGQNSIEIRRRIAKLAENVVDFLTKEWSPVKWTIVQSPKLNHETA